MGMRGRPVGVALLCVAFLCLCGCGKSAGTKKEQPAANSRSTDTEKAVFVAGKHNKVYHLRQCRYAADISSPVGFTSARDAEASGRVPCEFCNPRASEAKEP